MKFQDQQKRLYKQSPIKTSFSKPTSKNREIVLHYKRQLHRSFFRCKAVAIVAERSFKRVFMKYTQNQRNKFAFLIIRIQHVWFQKYKITLNILAQAKDKLKSV